jgi:hypothetical protein
MPATINEEGYWQQQYLDQLIEETNAGKGFDMSKRVPGQLQPNKYGMRPTPEEVAPPNHPNKAQADFDVLMDMIRQQKLNTLPWSKKSESDLPFTSNGEVRRPLNQIVGK